MLCTLVPSTIQPNGKMTGPDLKKWRKYRGLTGQHMANEIGVTPTTVFVVESKTKPIPKPWRWYIKYKESEEALTRDGERRVSNFPRRAR